MPEKYAYTGGVIGNGKTIGLTNGQGLEFTIGRADDSSYAHARTGINETMPYVGTELTGVGKLTFGFISDASKSGIICEKDTQIMICIKY